MRRSVGVPFAVVYYVILVWILSTFVLDTSDLEGELKGGLEMGDDVTDNMCAIIFGNDTATAVVGNYSDADGMLSRVEGFDASEKKRFRKGYENSGIGDIVRRLNRSMAFLPGIETTKEKPNNSTNKRGDYILFENDSRLLHVVTASVMAVVGISSLFHRSIRATMLLILPGLITNRSRHIIFSIALGCLVNHPIANIRVNFVKLLENSICMYRAVIALGCIKEKEV